MVTLTPRPLLELQQKLNQRICPLGFRIKLWMSPGGIRVSSWRFPPPTDPPAG